MSSCPRQIDEVPLGEVLRGTPAWIGDVLSGELGETPGGFCLQIGPLGNHEPLCASYTASAVSDMLRARVPIDVSLLLGGLLVGSALGVAVGRHCATHPGSAATRVLHVLTAFQLSTPVFFLALLVMYSFSSNVSEFVRLPFVSGSGDYVPFREDPIGYVKALWVPWLARGAAARRVSRAADRVDAARAVAGGLHPHRASEGRAVNGGSSTATRCR